MDAGGGELLAGAAFADEQHGTLHLGHAGKLLLEIEENVGSTQRLHDRLAVAAVSRERGH